MKLILTFHFNRDRSKNGASYPSLYYPEVYILHLGYKEFYANYKEMCTPQEYVEMLDPKYTFQERMYRNKSKNFKKGTTVKKSALPRFVRH